MTAVSVIGIGRMGGPMAACLVRAGHQVTVADVDDTRVERFVAEHGGHAAADARAAATRNGANRGTAAGLSARFGGSRLVRRCARNGPALACSALAYPTLAQSTLA